MHSVTACRELGSEGSITLYTIEIQWKNTRIYATILFFFFLDPGPIVLCLNLSTGASFPLKMLKILSYICGTVISEGVMWLHK